MRARATADRVWVESDENGWELHVHTDDGDVFMFNIHGTAFEFAGSAGVLELLDWRRRGDIRSGSTGTGEGLAARSYGVTEP